MEEWSEEAAKGQGYLCGRRCGGDGGCSSAQLGTTCARTVEPRMLDSSGQLTEGAAGCSNLLSSSPESSSLVPSLPTSWADHACWLRKCSSWLSQQNAPAGECADNVGPAGGPAGWCESSFSSALSGHEDATAGEDGASARDDVAGGAGGPGDNGPEELALLVSKRLGGGGASEIYKGFYKSAPAVIKVMHTGNPEKAMAHACEMAVLTSIAHPCIVQAYDCLPDLARLQPDGPPAGAGPHRCCGATASLRFRRLLPNDFAPAAAEECSVLILELCSLGTLGAALDGGALGPVLFAAGFSGHLVEVLLDIAVALAFLHSAGLVHGDVQAENVYLKQDHTRKLGVQAKLGGFSRAKVLDRYSRELDLRAVVERGPCTAGSFSTDGGSCRSFGGAGGGVALLVADEVFAFGALLLEVLHACEAQAVCSTGCPCASLAMDCMLRDPSARPPMAAVVDRLDALAGSIL